LKSFGRSGDTTLSASGFLVPCVMNMEKAGSSSPGQTNLYETTTSSEPSVVVITCASIVEPFIAPKSHGSSSQEVYVPMKSALRRFCTFVL
jgi:hypothetical protein